MPTIHVTNFASRKLHHGRVFSIMALPRQWEHGEGIVRALVPRVADLRAVRDELISMPEYRERYLAGLVGVDMRCGVLVSDSGEPLRDGDTICCACSREQAAESCCHRVWAAHELYAQGWTVILDGRPLNTEEGPTCG